MKILLVHDWLSTLSGAEEVLREIYAIYPNANIFTLFYDRKQIEHSSFSDAKIITSSLQKIPFIEKIYRKIPNFFPMAIEECDTREFDLVISSSHAVAKGVLTDANTCHISYMHTPMRYIWDLTHHYQDEFRSIFPLHFYMRYVFHRLRSWDFLSASRPDYMIANSQYIARRIRKVYRRDAHVIFPPVRLSEKVYENHENYYVTASRHVPYKNIPLIAASFVQMPDKKLKILGTGPDTKKVLRIIKNAKNIEFLGYQERNDFLKTIGNAKAFVFAADEDFGILPVEAQGLGVPVIAYKRGGVTETVLEGKTGLFFPDQEKNSLMDCVKLFETKEDKFNRTAIASHAQQFSHLDFREKFRTYVNTCLSQFYL